MNNYAIRNKDGLRPVLLKVRSLIYGLNIRISRHAIEVACVVYMGNFAPNAVAADEVITTPDSKSNAPIVINLKQFKVLKDDHGGVQLVDAKAVVPGDVIEYRAVYSNRGSVALPVLATLPIPTSLEYVKDSASANNNVAHTVALMDSKFSSEPLLRTVTIASGATVSRPLPYASYRYVRWDLGKLSPGKSVEVAVRAKVAQNLVTDGTNEDKESVLASSYSIKK